MSHLSVIFVVVILFGNCELLVWRTVYLGMTWAAGQTDGLYVTRLCPLVTCDDTAALWGSTRAVPDYSGLAMRSDISHWHPDKVSQNSLCQTGHHSENSHHTQHLSCCSPPALHGHSLCLEVMMQSLLLAYNILQMFDGCFAYQMRLNLKLQWNWSNAFYWKMWIYCNYRGMGWT